jgi:DNA-binding Lrp family transcriptional regulator
MDARFAGSRSSVRRKRERASLCVFLYGRIRLTRSIAIVRIFAESAYMESVVKALSRLDSIGEYFEVTGESDIVAFVSADDNEDLRKILKTKIMSIKGVKGTLSSVVRGRT